MRIVSALLTVAVSFMLSIGMCNISPAAEIGDFDTTDANNIARWPEGMTFANVNDSARADEGILARFYKDTNGSLTTTGSSNAYVISANQTLTAYYTGLWLRAKVNFSNTGAATLNVDSLGTKAIKRANGADPASGDIVSGTIYDFVYDGTNFQVLGLNALADGIVSTQKIADSAVTSAKIADGTIAWGDLAQTIFNQSGTAPATGDLVPFGDVSDSTNRKVTTIANLLALGGAGFKGVQVFTSSGTYTPSTGTTRVIAIVTGGGGGGGGIDLADIQAAAGGGGGGSGGTAIEVLSSATIGASQTVTIGAGGAAGAATGASGGTGGTTSIGALLSATGGTGGTGFATGVTQESNAIGGTGGAGSGGDLNLTGSAGGFGFTYDASVRNVVGGVGAPSFLGGGGPAAATTDNPGTVAGSAGANGGGGGGAAVLNTTTGAAGGAGGAGVAIVLEFGS